MVGCVLGNVRRGKWRTCRTSKIYKDNTRSAESQPEKRKKPGENAWMRESSDGKPFLRPVRARWSRRTRQACDPSRAFFGIAISSRQPSSPEPSVVSQEHFFSCGNREKTAWHIFFYGEKREKRLKAAKSMIYCSCGFFQTKRARIPVCARKTVAKEQDK